MTSTAVVILNFNGAHLLQQFLPGIIKHSPHAQIVVADNASTDDSRILLREKFPEVKLIELDKNYGYSGGYNRALQLLEATYCVLLNSDVDVTEGWLQPMVELLDKNPDIAAVQPKILSYNNREFFEYAGAGGGFIDALGYPFCRGRLFDYLEKDTGQYNDTRQVFWASGACLMVRTSVYKDLGGLDEDFFAHMEEIDFCWRIIRSNQKVYYRGTSVVYHIGAGTLAYGNPRKIYLNFLNNLRLIIYHLPSRELVWKLPLRIALDWVAAMRFLFVGKTNACVAVFKAHGSLVQDLKKILRKRQYWKTRLPFRTQMIYKGLVVWEYYIRKKTRIIQ